MAEWLHAPSRSTECHRHKLNVRALEDRAIIIHFCPSNDEVHQSVRGWFDDPEVYEFVGKLMPMISAVSMRHYRKGSQLRRAGLADWRTSLLQMVIPDSRVACVLAVQHDPALLSEEQRVERFIAFAESNSTERRTSTSLSTRQRQVLRHSNQPT